jgi:S1-C subfamily serine protease
VIGVHDPGDKVELTVIRDGKRIKLPVTLGERPERAAGAR